MDSESDPESHTSTHQRRLGVQRQAAIRVLRGGCGRHPAHGSVRVAHLRPLMSIHERGSTFVVTESGWPKSLISSLLRRSRQIDSGLSRPFGSLTSTRIKVSDAKRRVTVSEGSHHLTRALLPASRVSPYEVGVEWHGRDCPTCCQRVPREKPASDGADLDWLRAHPTVERHTAHSQLERSLNWSPGQIGRCLTDRA